jgi:GTPase SAR1 family protein
MKYIDITRFINKREQIENLLLQIAEISNRLNVRDEAIAIQNIVADLRKDNFQIVVVGEFSRGKSMFINALIGEKILPSLTRPATTIINRIAYNNTLEYHLYYREKEKPSKIVSKEQFKLIVAPIEPIVEDRILYQEYAEKIEYVTSIKYARIGVPFPACKDGIEIVDTPGTNDMDYRREEITYNYIPKSEAAIFLLSANQPLAESEIQFLKDRILAEDIQKIFFVINFKDRLNSYEEKQKVISHVRKGLTNIVSEPKIFLVSAKEALNYRRREKGEDVKVNMDSFEDTGFPEIEAALSHFLVYEKAQTKLLKPVEKGIRKCDNLIKNNINTSKAVLNQKLQEVQEKVNQLRPEVVKVKKYSYDAIQNFRNTMNTSYCFIEEQLKLKLERIARAAVECVDMYNGELTESAVANFIENTVAPLQTELQASISRIQNEVIQNELSRVNRLLGYNWDKLEDHILSKLISQHSATQFQIVLPSLKEETEKELMLIEAPKRTFIDYDRSSKSQLYNMVMDTINFIGELISALFGLDFKDNRETVLGRVRLRVDRRYRSVIPGIIKTYQQQWKTSLNILTQSLIEEIERKIKVIEHQFATMIKEKENEEQDINKKTQFLLQQEDELTKIKNELITIRNENVRRKDK